MCNLDDAPNPMKTRNIHRLMNWCIALVWLVNGLFCKLLDLVPRHRQIVARILGEEYSVAFTKLIGISEILMAVWIWTGYRSKLNAVAQMTIVAVMNTIEFMMAPDLLLWGRFNALYAFLFILVVGCNEFIAGKAKETTRA